MCATAVSAVTTPVAGHFSDRFGRKRMYIIGIAGIGVFTFIYFALLNTAIPVVIFIAIILSFIPHDMAYGPQAALIAECFPPRLRYSGSPLGFPLGLDYRQRSSAADRDGVARQDRIRIFSRALCPVEQGRDPWSRCAMVSLSTRDYGSNKDGLSTTLGGGSSRSTPPHVANHPRVISAKVGCSFTPPPSPSACPSDNNAHVRFAPRRREALRPP